MKKRTPEQLNKGRFTYFINDRCCRTNYYGHGYNRYWYKYGRERNRENINRNFSDGY